MGFRIAIGAALLAVVALAGCGGNSDSGWGTVIGANEPPAIRHLRILHDDPEAPGLVRAVAELRDPDRDGVEIHYAWEIAGVAQSEDGPELRLPRVRKGTRVKVTAVAERGRARGEPAVRIVHILNPRSERVGNAWRNARPSEDPDAESDGESGSDAPESDVPEGREFASGSSVTELSVGADGEALRYAVDVPRTDGESRIRFRLLQGPEGMWVHPASGEVTWLPEPWQTGAYPVEVEISDASGAVTVEAFTVNAGNEVSTRALPAKVADP